MKDEWAVSAPAKCVSECGHIKEQDKHEIIISKDVWHVIRAMLRKYPQDEWQMMLSGSVDKDTCYVTGYYITKQEVGAATVTNTDSITKERIDELRLVAGIHSHVNMGVTPSGTDINDSVLGSLIEYHMIVNNRHELNGMRRAHLPCGKVVVASCDVLLEDDVDIDSLQIEGLERITKKVYTYTYTADEEPEWKKKWAHKDVTHRDYDDEALSRAAYGGYY